MTLSRRLLTRVVESRARRRAALVCPPVPRILARVAGVPCASHQGPHRFRVDCVGSPTSSAPPATSARHRHPTLAVCTQDFVPLPRQSRGQPQGDAPQKGARSSAAQDRTQDAACFEDSAQCGLSPVAQGAHIFPQRRDGPRRTCSRHQPRISSVSPSACQPRVVYSRRHCCSTTQSIATRPWVRKFSHSVTLLTRGAATMANLLGALGYSVLRIEFLKFLRRLSIRGRANAQDSQSRFSLRRRC